jgi:hypothetical protein
MRVQLDGYCIIIANSLVYKVVDGKVYLKCGTWVHSVHTVGWLPIYTEWWE